MADKRSKALIVVLALSCQHDKQTGYHNVGLNGVKINLVPENARDLSKIKLSGRPQKNTQVHISSRALI